MKREIPGFVRELPVTILILAVILAIVFWPVYRRYIKKAEDLRTAKAQEMELRDEIVEDAPGNADISETNEDPDGLTD